VGKNLDSLEGAAVEVSPSDLSLIPNEGISVSLDDEGHRSRIITPSANKSGTAQISITVTNSVGSDSKTFDLIVSDVNDAPTLSAIANQTTIMATPTSAIAFTVGDVDNDLADISLSATSSNTTLVPTANITLGGAGANR